MNSAGMSGCLGGELGLIERWFKMPMDGKVRLIDGS